MSMVVHCVLNVLVVNISDEKLSRDKQCSDFNNSFFLYKRLDSLGHI